MIDFNNDDKLRAASLVNDSRTVSWPLLSQTSLEPVLKDCIHWKRV